MNEPMDSVMLHVWRGMVSHVADGVWRRMVGHAGARVRFRVLESLDD